ncbi:class I SAM-dependent methyltransferase [bacterium]|nr:class I SAM-dependent methyltransferase [bacterium]MCB2179230.1 class I SAM-dependent methyltransferase [bacterium]
MRPLIIIPVTGWVSVADSTANFEQTFYPHPNILYNEGMQPEIANQLLKLNHQFYQTFAEHFSATRQRLQPGVVRITEALPHTASILDLGCGNGLLASHLAEHGHTGLYVGLDTSPNLIEIARSQEIAKAQFFVSDLTTPDWDAEIPAQQFDFIFCFAVMHHIPSHHMRVDFLKKVRSLIAPDGRFIHSNWQFLNSQKLIERIQPWGAIGLSEEMLDEHDYLLDWRHGGTGLRYVHYYTNMELHRLATQSGFQIKGLFVSDGASGNLAVYHIWEPK